MSRHKKLDPPLKKIVTLPSTVWERIDSLLFSPLEGRVPQGQYQQFWLSRVRDYFDTQELDLAPYLSSMPGEHTVRAAPETIERLREALRHVHP